MEKKLGLIEFITVGLELLAGCVVAKDDDTDDGERDRLKEVGDIVPGDEELGLGEFNITGGCEGLEDDVIGIKLDGCMDIKGVGDEGTLVSMDVD